MPQGFVYILTNDRQNVLYTGCTNNLRKRLLHHQHRLIPGFTKKYNVHRLVHFEVFADLATARQREKQIKGLLRSKKEGLINNANPTWRDLYPELTDDQSTSSTAAKRPPAPGPGVAPLERP